MRFTPTLAAMLLATTFAVPALAQDAAPSGPDEAASTPPDGETAPPPPFKITGGITGISDYRFRGLTQRDEHFALQGTLNVNHESGLYVGVWASQIDGDGSVPLLAGYGDVEVDLYGGFTKTFGGVGVDAGLLYYYYPDRVTGLNTDFFEPYGSLSYTFGPVSAKAGVAYAFSGQDGLNFTPGSDDNLYGYLDAGIGIPSTPVTVKGHVGFTNGSLGLANPTVTDDTYTDWSLTAEYVNGPVKLGVSYVDTDVTNRNVVGIGKYAERLGRGSTVLGYVGLSF